MSNADWPRQGPEDYSQPLPYWNAKGFGVNQPDTHSAMSEALREMNRRCEGLFERGVVDPAKHSLALRTDFSDETKIRIEIHVYNRAAKVGDGCICCS